MSQFNAYFFRKNRERLRASISKDCPIVLTANVLLQHSTDASYPFRQDSSFWYFTGVEQPDVLMVIDADETYLILPPSNHVREVFDGPYEKDRLRMVAGVDDVLDYSSGWKKLKKAVKQAGAVATLPVNTMLLKYYGVAPNPARQILIDRLLSECGDIELEDIKNEIARLRMVKSPQEVAATQHAIDITIDALQDVESQLQAGMYEYEIDALLLSHFRRHNAKHAYEPIIAAGKNACVIHYVQNDAKLRTNQTVLIDVGAETGHGLADITRTYIVGTPTSRQREVMAAVSEVQSYALGLMKPGLAMKAYEKQVETFMGEKLLQLGLIQKNEPDAVRQYYPHATSHFLGLDVHDVGDYEQPLAENMVLTVEPGIYIPEENIGVRIEDNIVLTKSSNKVLSKRLPGLPASLTIDS